MCVFKDISASKGLFFPVRFGLESAHACYIEGVFGLVLEASLTSGLSCHWLKCRILS